MKPYERIASVIRYLDEHHTEQPNLATLARHLGLSESRLHHLFSAWAGITPKDFLQCLTLAHAKQLLQQGESVLDASLGAGLSGPGRLHDLCVTLEAASPGELKSGGAGWTIQAGFAESPFGRCLIAESPRGICHLSFTDPGGEKDSWHELQTAFPGAKLQPDDAMAARRARQIFSRPARSAGNVRLRTFVCGTPFQVRVWQALLRIPSGCLVSYSQVAAAIGHPKAARAVGSAVGQNEVSFLIPCHRVIRETGVFGHYRWGAARKRMLVAWETAGAPAATEARVARGRDRTKARS